MPINHQTKKVVVLAFITLTLIIGVGYLASSQSALAPSESKAVAVNFATTTSANSAGAFLPYDESNLVQFASARHVIFFGATWCPGCRLLVSDITENQDTIPAGLIIHRADFDTDLALRQKYGVTVQHTFVEVNNTGALIKKWNGGYSLEDVLAAL